MNAVQYILDKLKQFELIVPYNDFRELSAAVAREYHIPIAKADLLIDALKGKLQLGMPEKQYEGEKAAVNFSKGKPGFLAEPMSSLNPIGRIELISKATYTKGDTVRVKANDQAPWGAEYTGVIESINKDNTMDIRDIKTNVIYRSQPERLLSKPLATGREDVRIQQRRVGDPKGMGESAGDIAGPEVHQSYPNANWEPNGQQGQEVKNPQSMFYKEAQK